MISTKTCKVKLLNKVFDIKCPEGEEANLQLAAAKLSERMLHNQEKFLQLDNYKCLLLAALDVAHELIRCKSDQAHQRQQVTQFISSLESKINKVVGGEVDSIPQTD